MTIIRTYEATARDRRVQTIGIASKTTADASKSLAGAPLSNQ
jgi:hypothetical protein